jgi:ABC-type dipeptide/oligopeptide/nickel transport system permease subunit
LCAIFASQITPHDPKKNRLLHQFIVPAWMSGGSNEHLLSTDYFGRFVFSRIIYGARVSILGAASAILISVCFGALLGLISDHSGGVTDTIIMRITDRMGSMPWLVIASILLANAFGTSIIIPIFILGFFGRTMYPRKLWALSLVIEVPTPINPSCGCHFHPRCLSDKDNCQKAEPLLEELGTDHKVNCHFWK